MKRYLSIIPFVVTLTLIGCGDSKNPLQPADDPNSVALLMEWDSLDDAQKFAQSQELREAMQQSGVIGYIGYLGLWTKREKPGFSNRKCLSGTKNTYNCECFGHKGSQKPGF